jgi:hypothetical protein
MTAKPIKTPGPDHPISIERNPSRVVVTLAGRVIADTIHALTLREAGYRPVHYIPREDVDMAAIERTQHSTYCPYKGDASYYSISAGGARSSMRSGRTRSPMRPWLLSGITSPSTLIEWTQRPCGPCTVTSVGCSGSVANV